MDFERVKNFKIPTTEHAYTFKDAILFALGLGYGDDPLAPDQLQFVYEDGLKVNPAICNVLAHPGFWAKNPELKIDWVKILHGEQDFVIHKPFGKEGKVRGEYEIVAIDDKGADKGAILHLVKTLDDVASNELLATVRTVIFMRGDGGQGGFGEVPLPPAPLPDREPDIVYDVKTLPQSALIYRLSGDYNPIHADPVAAEKGGLGKPILHGLCSMGVATRALIATVCEGDPDRLRSQSVRFSKMVWPGETIRAEIFTGGDRIGYRCRVVERDAIVLDRGYAEVAAA